LLADQPERGELLGDVTVIISELVTNAVNAGATSALVTLDWHRHQLRLVVADDAPGVPALQAPTRDETHGRGLAITQSLSTVWGVEPPSRGYHVGKQVWAELRVAPVLTTTLLCHR
jgi:anti-sigma regulatory factor (Ser/Thr protein kinase)